MAAMGRARLRPELRRTQLVDCAISAAAENGIARVTHSQVAARAGVSIPAVHSYFRTRDDLVGGVLAEVERYVLQILDESLSAPGAPFERLHALAVRFGRDAAERPDLIIVWLDWSTHVRSVRWARYLEVFDRAVMAVAGVIGEAAGAAPGETARVAAARAYIGGAYALALVQFAGAAPGEIEALAEQLARTALSPGRT